MLPEYQVNYATDAFKWDISNTVSENTAAVLAFIDATFGRFPALQVYDGPGNDTKQHDSDGDGNRNNAKRQRISQEAAKFQFQIDKLGERALEKEIMAELKTDRNGFCLSIIALFIRDN
ncbi:hypothetical protein HDU77_008017 [Chytriomyces hyalinus]|nr:hypothetical protein HDU77_008017 [Chytriomyces hyalinus]